MGWPWSSSTTPESGDALSKLDPALREFLEKEAPQKYNPPPPAATPAPRISRQAEAVAEKKNLEPQNPSDVPSESLYQDGRYAHLWKTYTPLSTIESRNVSEQDKLKDIIESYNQRKAAIGRAALENCVVEQMAVSDCFTNGDWSSRMTMCRTDNRKLDRCYTMQGKFLKALGYLSVRDRSAVDEERIQMHADKLYHRMLEQEKLIEEAKKEGKPIPEFPTLLSKTNVSAAMNGGLPPSQEVDQFASTKAAAAEDGPISPFTLEGLPESTKKELQKRFESKTGAERILEEEAARGELEASRFVAEQIGGIYEKERMERLKRQEEGKTTVGDTIKKLWGW